MLLRVCCWLTLVFLFSVVFVSVASVGGWLPELADIGRSRVGGEPIAFLAARSVGHAGANRSCFA